jgi:tape measure domain-containing protein|nr:MAG TPA: Tail tape measure [Caudoviricetes sp.]
MLLQELVTAIRFNVDNISSVDNVIEKLQRIQAIGTQMSASDINDPELIKLSEQLQKLSKEVGIMIDDIGESFANAFNKVDLDSAGGLDSAISLLEGAGNQARKLQAELDKLGMESFEKIQEDALQIGDTSALDELVAKYTQLVTLKKSIAYKEEKGIDYSKELAALGKLNQEIRQFGKDVETKKKSHIFDDAILQTKHLSTEIKNAKRQANNFNNFGQGVFGRFFAGLQNARLSTFIQQLGISNNLLGVMQGTMGRLVGPLAAFAGISFSIHSYIAMSDQLKTIEGQIKNVVKSGKETKRVEEEIYAMAGRSRQSYAESANLFTSVARNASELGKSTDDILKFTEDVSNAMLLGGGSAASQQAALVQLGQALGSGTLRGDELNSIMEQAPKLAETIAKGMGTTIGSLRKLGSEGKLTAKDVFEAVRKQSDSLKKDLGNMPWTVAQATNRIRDSVAQLFFAIENKFGFGDKMARVIATIADQVDKLTVKVNAIDMSTWTPFLITAGIYASVLYMWLHRTVIQSAIITGFNLLGGAVRGVGVAIRGTIGMLSALKAAYAVMRAVSLRTALAMAAHWIIATAPAALVVAAIVLIILLIQDVYIWMKGGDSVMGRMFGSWDDMCKKMAGSWLDFGKTFKDWCKKDAVSAIKDLLGWIGNLIVAFTGLKYLFDNAKKPGVPLFEKWFGKDTFSSLNQPMSNVIDSDWYKKNVLGRDVSTGGRNINNSGNQTVNNYWTFSGMSAEESAKYANDMNNKVVFGGWNPTFGEFAP